MKVAQWAEIRRLSEIEGLSQRAHVNSAASSPAPRPDALRSHLIPRPHCGPSPS